MNNTSLPLSPNGLATSMAIVSVIYMLILSLAGLAGYGQEAVNMMRAWNIGYELTVLGIIIGIVVSALMSYISGWLIAFFYNKFAVKK